MTIEWRTVIHSDGYFTFDELKSLGNLIYAEFDFCYEIVYGYQGKTEYIALKLPDHSNMVLTKEQQEIDRDVERFINHQLEAISDRKERRDNNAN